MRKRSLSQSAITPSKSKRPCVVDPSIELAAAINDVGKELVPGTPEDTSSPEHIDALDGDVVMEESSSPNDSNLANIAEEEASGSSSKDDVAKNSSDDGSSSDVCEGIMKFC